MLPPGARARQLAVGAHELAASAQAEVSRARANSKRRQAPFCAQVSEKENDGAGPSSSKARRIEERAGDVHALCGDEGLSANGETDWMDEADEENENCEQVQETCEADSFQENTLDEGDVLEEVGREKDHFASVGILESIYVENFMCHECFEFEFGPNVNIIQGENGSGKSAIVAALQTCLGASASSTERARVVSGLIRRGQTQALIRIRLRNCLETSTSSGLPNGRSQQRDFACVDDRFRPSVYGNAVIIERRIKKEGQNSWTFMNASMQKVKPNGTATNELRQICDHFNIQVANPVSIMTQTKSKQFLATGKPQDHYRFFMDATLLTEVKHCILAAMESKNELERVLSNKEEYLPQLQSTLDTKQKQFEEAQILRTMDQRMAELGIALSWTFVRDQERELDSARTSRKKAIKLLKVVDEEFQQIEADVRTLETRMNEEHAKIRSETERMKSFVDQSKAIEAELNKLQSTKKQLGRRELQVQRSYEQARARRANIEEKIVEERRKGGQQQAQRGALIEQKQALDIDRRNFEASLERLERDSDFAADESVQFAAKHREMNERWKRQKMAINQVRSSLEHLKNAERDAIAKWGADAPRVLQIIEEGTRRGLFHIKPVGPIGSFVSVRDHKWAKAAQTAIGRNLLQSFLVHDSHDEKVLRGLLDRIRVSMVQTPLNVGPYSIPEDARPPREYHTLLDQLVVSHDLVFNVLVDQAEIERHVLFEDKEEMLHVAGRELRNVKNCWHASGDRAWSRYGSVARRAATGEHVLIGSSVKHAIHDEEAKLARLLKEHGQLQHTIREHEQTRMQLSNRESQANKEKQAVQRQLDVLLRRRADLERTLDALDEGFDAYQFEAEIKNVDADAAEALHEVEHLQCELSQCDIRIAELIQQRSHLDASLDSGTADELEAQYRNSQTEYAQLLRSKQRKVSVLNEATQKREAAQAEEDRCQRLLNQALVKAAATGSEKPREEELQRSQAQIEGEMEALRHRIRDESSRFEGRDLEQLELDFLDFKRKKETIEGRMHELRAMRDRIQAGIVKRKKSWRRLRKDLQHITNLLFGYYLARRKHAGRIDFADKEETLNITVQIGTHTKGDGSIAETKELRSLSGGEKSFVTLALVLALGESMGIPFRIMDEFDVFMDEANRHAAYGIIVKMASEQKNRQFIFITPHQLPNIKASESCKIQVLRPPQRQHK
ncbi:Structural maintenance of chromosomes protein 6 [Porphyridium purpureum]|uniref:Structural maintenance of chromosomes protein 6 n=1 Tax=Porphyridium purpureum TaxID=35688 RepID=A0A5J4Z9C4_PORPP|nr:Structural maintenance of chromosomes protein 6 [Porphyridium purpureum]|eukprot:POR3357..scf295_1